jgi:hypothetical protein
MIPKRNLLVLALVLALTGCTDTMDSITRELRNANNESIDALMMVTSEQQAYRMNTRVLKPLNERYSNIEYKLKAWESNRDSKKEIVEQTFNSNGFYLYIAELEVNKVRYTFEKTRLRNLYKQYQERKLEEMRVAGDNNPIITDPRGVCPELHDLIVTEAVLKNIETQLKEPKLKQMVSRFPSWEKSVPNYPELHRMFLEKSKIFAPKVPQLVW